MQYLCGGLNVQSYGIQISILTLYLSGSCKQFGLFHQLLLVANQVFVCTLLTMRTWALYGRNIRVLLFMVGCAASLLGVASWSLVGQQSTFPTITAGCHMALSDKTGIHIAVAWEALFVYDSLVLVLTLLKTYNARHRHNFTSTGRTNIVSLVLRDGAIYYAVMATANLANLLTFYLADALLKGCLSSFASCLSVTMMSRLMLNLHSTATSGIFSTFPTSDSSTGVAFTSRVPDPNLDSPFGTNSSGTDFEMEGKTPIESLHARTELIVREATLHEIEVQRSAL